MKITGIFYCSMEPGHANLDLISLIEELSKRHQIDIFSLSKQNDVCNIKYHKINPFLSHWFFYMLHVFFLMKTIKKIQPNFIVLDSVFFISIPGYFLNKFFKIPYVIYCRELILENTRYFKTPLRTLRKLVMKKSNLIVAMDEGLKEYFQRETGVSVELIPASIELGKFKCLRNIRNELGLPTNDKLILYMGNLSQYRGLNLLLESFSKIKTNDLKIVLAGRVTVGEMDYLDNLIKKLDLQDFVIFLKWLPYSEIPSLIHSCDICVDPYPRYGFEEFQVGLKLLEYMAAGKPVLAINVTGNKFIIKDGYNGILAEPNINDFSKKLDLLIRNPNLCDQLGKNAFNTIRNNYNSIDVTKKFESLLRNII